MHNGTEFRRRSILLPVATLSLLGGLVTACDQLGRLPRASDSACVECHAEDRARVTMPDHSHFPDDCERCHGSKTSWKPADFDHDDWPLDGAHTKQPCGACHDKKPVPTECVGCHEKDRSRPLAPNHLAASFSTDCKKCHNTTDWKDVEARCADCHGSDVNAAPPKSTTGETATTARGVGAHQAHLETSDWHLPTKCDSCHQVPGDKDDPGHNDSALPAELSFAHLAVADGAKPSWDGTRCSGTYCHGATLSGGTNTAPSWTEVDGSQIVCGSCHGLPPGDGHTAATNCEACHGSVVAAGQKIINPVLHINGRVDDAGAGNHPKGFEAGAVHGPEFIKDTAACKVCHGTTLDGGTATGCAKAGCHATNWKTDCVFCHGGLNDKTGAPPESVKGDTSPSVKAVGRHTEHLHASATHAAYACATCHSVPKDALSAGHIDPGPAEQSFSGLAAGSSYSSQSATCSNVYCHGDGRPNSGGSVQWTASISGCTACHGDPPDTGEHKKHVQEEGYGCQRCHQCVAGPGKTISDPSRHVDGKIDVCGGNLNWNASARSCSPGGGGCHGTETW